MARGSHSLLFDKPKRLQSYLKLVASGEVDGTMLEALEDYVKRRKRRSVRAAVAR
jgi:hypothetical protein